MTVYCTPLGQGLLSGINVDGHLVVEGAPASGAGVYVVVSHSTTAICAPANGAIPRRANGVASVTFDSLTPGLETRPLVHDRRAPEGKRPRVGLDACCTMAVTFLGRPRRCAWGPWRAESVGFRRDDRDRPRRIE